MILRPLEPQPAANRQFAGAWPVVERTQRQKYESCWMITQPSHAALSGEIAARLAGCHLPELDEPLLRSIALHDAGWGQPDAQAILRGRSGKGERPHSFLDSGIFEFLSAWTLSADIAQKVSAAGGYIVSRHFTRLAEQRLAHGSDPEAARKKLRAFLGSESARQEKLVARQPRSPEELERLTDVLQFCDLLSLYVCCGAQDSAVFPEYFGVKTRLTISDGHYRLDPPLVEPGSEFLLAMLRYPEDKSESSREFRVVIGPPELSI